jgi:hypothetical protein
MIEPWHAEAMNIVLKPSGLPLKQQLEFRQLFSEHHNDPRKFLKAFKAVIGPHPWVWPWFDEWREKFRQAQAWPGMWTEIAELDQEAPPPDPDEEDDYGMTPEGVQATLAEAQVELLHHSVSMMGYRLRDMVNLLNRSSSPEVWRIKLTSIAGCPVEEAIAAQFADAVAGWMPGQDFPPLPPYFPGDRTSVDLVNPYKKS